MISNMCGSIPMFEGFRMAELSEPGKLTRETSWFQVERMTSTLYHVGSGS
jgi:hypothetical protein